MKFQPCLVFQAPTRRSTICAACDMDGMIGKEFESGLATLKAIVER